MLSRGDEEARDEALPPLSVDRSLRTLAQAYALTDEARAEPPAGGETGRGDRFERRIGETRQRQLDRERAQGGE